MKKNVKAFAETVKSFVCDSVYRKIICSHLLISIVSLIFFSIFSIVVIKNIITYNSGLTNNLFLSTMESSIISEFKLVENLSKELLYSPEAINYVNRTNIHQSTDELLGVMNAYVYFNSSVNSITYINSGGEYISTSDRVLNYSSIFDGFVRKSQKTNEPFWEAEDSVYTDDMYYVRRVNNLLSKYDGTLIFNINNKFISDINKNTGNGFKHNILVFLGNKIIYSDCKDLLFNKRTLYEDKYGSVKDYSYFVTNSGFCNMSVVTIIKTSDLYRKLYLWIILVVLIFAALVFIIFAASHRLSEYIVRPINECVEVINKNKGGMNVYFNINTRDEFSIMQNAFNDMLNKLETYRERCIEEVVLNKDARIKLLQSQITPHFLFNTLDMINWSAILSGNKEIPKMIKSLSNILSVRMGKTEEIVKLTDELDYFNDYCTVINLRFGDDISIRCDTDSEYDNVSVIPMMLVTAVENALMHGKDPDKKLSINIAFLRENDIFNIYVYDNGKGIDENKLNELNKSLENSSDDERQNSKRLSGLKNLNRRIKLMFGQKYGITVYSEEGKYTEVTISIPYIDSDKII